MLPSTVAGTPQLRAVTFDLSRALTWRPIGPFRAGPVTAIAGVPSRLGVFYAGTEGGGLWQTTDFGANWQPVFGAPPIGKVTAVAVAPTDPNVVFAATGSASAGGALYRSSDSGTSWNPVGLPSRQTLAHVAVDPYSASQVFATVEATTAADGTHGIFRSDDGGLTFEKIADTTGAAVGPGVFLHPRRQSLVLVVGIPDGVAGGPLSLLRSTNSGGTWQRVLGLQAFSAPTHLDVAVAPDGTMFLLVASAADAALYRSDDIGGTWTPINRSLPPQVRARVRPRLAVAASGGLVIAAGRTFMSTDQGQSFSPGPSPEDRPATLVWADPALNGVTLLAGTAGASATVNGGQTWSRADALSATVVDRISTDVAFPYRVCAVQASWSSCTPAQPAPPNRDRPDRWEDLPHQLGGQVVSDPLDPDLVFGGGGFRYDRRTGQLLSLEPQTTETGDGTPPLVFTGDGRTLFAGMERVWRTTNGGLNWTPVSPDLPAAAGQPARITALAVSPIDARALWMGLDDGSVHVTRDAGSVWTPTDRAARGPRASVRVIEPSRFDVSSVYIVVAQQASPISVAPSLLRTRDNGLTWTNIGANIPGASTVYVVREDPFRRGLLYAGTDRSVFISFDDGEQWQPLDLNLPPTTVVDLVVKDSDLLVATAGRGVWVLDDVSILRQVTADVLQAPLFLFRPAQAWRFRAADPAGRGATLSYLLNEAASAVTLEIVETTTGDVIRRFSATDDGTSPGDESLATGAGLHRVSWDLRYPPPVNDAAATAGTQVVPGIYQVRLTVDGRTIRQALTVRADPRIRASTLDLTAQRDLGRSLDRMRAAVAVARRETAMVTGDVPALDRLAADLERLASALDRADVRPTARLEAAIEAALDRAALAVGAVSR